MQFLRAYRSCFTFSVKELGALIGPSIRIELATNTPIFRHPYRYNDMEGPNLESDVGSIGVHLIFEQGTICCRFERRTRPRPHFGASTLTARIVCISGSSYPLG
ncbi:unnamed protein product [Sphagnum tenellum]